MDNIYTETMLKKLNKDGLLKIAGDNEIAIPEGATNPQIITLILEKGCPLPASAPGGDKTKSGANDKPVDDGNPKFGKDFFMKSNWYSHKRDVLDAVLANDKEYSIAAVEKLIAGK